MAVDGQPRLCALAFSLLCLLAIFGSGCQMAPAVVGAARGWNVGVALKYQLTSAILSREAGKPRPGGDVGFRMTGEIGVAAVWQDPADPETFLLRIELESPRLWIKSRRAPEPEGFVEHKSKLDDLPKNPIYVLWKHGDIKSLYLGPDETPSSSNLKRGLASLFQYRTLDGEYKEEDVSGYCNTSYVTLGSRKIEKRKNHCDDSILKKKIRHPNQIFDVKLSSARKIIYELNDNLIPERIDETEQHEATLAAKPEVGTTVKSERSLERISMDSEVKTVQARTVEQALTQLNPGYRGIPIELQIEPNVCPESGCRPLEEIINENRDSLENSALGTARSASAFLKLIPSIREATLEQLSKILKSPKNRSIKKQLLDVIGSSATLAGHRAAMKYLRNDEIGDETERYLWSLSMSPKPNSEIIGDVLKRSEETMQNDRISETLALTAAAMARNHESPIVREKVRSSLEIGLQSCSGDDCRLKFLRALKNLRSDESLPILLSWTKNGTKTISVAAWRAITSMSSDSLLSKDIRRAASRAFYQRETRHLDSTVRTLAADVILSNQPSVTEIEHFLEYLATRDSMYEVKRYVAQRIDQLSEKNEHFRNNLYRAILKIREKKYFQNYDNLSYRGLSTAFTRPFLTSSSANGSLVTVQEVNSGLLKRGTVDVVVKTGSHEESLFSLGLFAGGLGSFVSSSSSSSDVDHVTPDDDESATAGMEISLLGVGIRPFVFFSGQGELMGHVWSGTASERTPAYQSIANLHRHREIVPLNSGFVAEIDVEGAMSFDLAGQIQLSLWSRNAKSLVEMAAGIVVRGDSRVRADFVQSTAEFAFTVEPKLELSTNVDFSGPVALCMRLVQPETTIRHNVYKIERIPGSRHRLRKTRRTVSTSPGKCYLLNRKNNEMCSKVLS